MTDAEIIKNLECCTNDDEPNCKECTKRPHIYCMCELLEEALDLIQRQQERIERLKDNLDAVLKERADHTEAIKEFADKVVHQLKQLPNVNSDYWNSSDLIDREDAIDSIKEMVGESDDR